MGTSSDFPALMPVYKTSNLYFERGEGTCLWDDKGQRYLDFIGGIAVAGLGHANPVIVKALDEQAHKVWITSNIFKCHNTERLAKRLVDLCFADTVFFQNSGAEAWECGVKVIRKYFSAIGKPERYRVITFQGCFHGRTLAGIAAAKTEKMIGGFGPVTDGFDQVPWNDIAALRKAITDKTAAICIEPVQGEGGMRAASQEFMQSLRAICDEFGLLLYFDEIQCGFGRTGYLFAHQKYGITPDVMCVAKALGNGYPIGACLATAKAAQGMTVGTHGSTYGGNPLATAIGNSVLNILSDKSFLDQVKEKSRYFWEKLDTIINRHPKIFKEHRGSGMMQGLVCIPPNTDIIEALRNEKLITIQAGDNVLRMLPPLVVTHEQIDEAADIIDRVASNMEQRP